MNRYARQMILPEIGQHGQQKLASAHILVLGAGGLGSPVLQYLAGTGIGHIRIVDPDRVEKSNLHRQPLFNEHDQGVAKAEVAKSRLRQFNPDVVVDAVVGAADAGNIEALCSEVDLVLDCADSFAVTYVASDHCHQNNLPLISASALGTRGYAGGFCGNAPSVRAVFPDIPAQLQSCATAGVMGPVVGILGSLQAQMALSVLLGIKPSPLGQLVSFDGIRLSTSSFRFDNAQEPESMDLPFISPQSISADDFVVELRSAEEAAQSVTKDAKRMHVEDFKKEINASLPDKGRIVFVCRSGMRAWQAAKLMKQWRDTPVALVAAGTNNGETK